MKFLSGFFLGIGIACLLFAKSSFQRSDVEAVFLNLAREKLDLAEIQNNFFRAGDYVAGREAKILINQSDQNIATADMLASQRIKSSKNTLKAGISFLIASAGSALIARRSSKRISGTS